MKATVYCKKCGRGYENVRPDILILECRARDCNGKYYVTEIDEMYWDW